MPGRMVTRGAKVGAMVALSVAAWPLTLRAQEQVQVVVTAVPNPVAPGSCAGIWAEVRNAQNQRLVELNGVPLHSRSYDFSLPSTPGVTWRDNDPASGYLCVQAGVPAATVPLIATVRSTTYSGATIITIQSSTPPQAVAAAPQAASGYPVPAAGAVGVPQPTNAQPTYAQPTYAPAAVGPTPPAGPAQPATAQPAEATGGTQPGYGQTAAPGSGQGAYAPQQAPAVNPYAPMQSQEPGPPSGTPASAAAPPPAYAPQPVAGATSQTTAPTSTSPATPPAPAAAAPGTAIQPAQPEAAQKGVGGFLKRFGNHVKHKAGEVTNQTAQNLAGSATQLVDTTLQTGSGLVSTTVAGAGNTARMTIGGAGKSLIPSALRGAETSDNLASAVAGGRAVLRAMRFTAGTAVLEPPSQELAVRLAVELKKVLLANPGTYLLSAHVDPILTPAGVPIPSASQQLSERRAAAVKAVLVKNGVLDTQLIALGYGASQPAPEATTDGMSSSARIEIARTQ